MALTGSPIRTPPSQAHNVRAILSVRGFRRLLGVRMLSQVADGFFQAALGGSVLFNPQKQAGAVAIAAGFAVLLLPYSLIGPYVGVFLDRWSRRSVLFITNMLRASLVVVATAFIWLGVEGTGLVVLALAIIGLNRLFLAGISAATPHVVDDRRLVTANALSGTIGSFCFSLGLAIAVVLLKMEVVHATFHGYAEVAALAPLGYVASALLARASYGHDDLGPDLAEHRRESLLSGVVTVGRGMIAGIGHLAGKRGAAYAMLAQAGFRMLFGVLTLATLLLYREYFSHGGDDIEAAVTGIGMLFVGGSLGVVAAAFLTPPIARRIGGWRWIAGLIASLGVVVPLCALPFKPWLLVVAVFAINVAAQGTKIVVDTALQHECADEYRGRVFSVNDTTFNLAFVIGLFIAATTLPDDGHSPVAIALVSIGYLAIAAWYATVGGRWARRVGDDIAEPERSVR